eukprot:gene9976-16488_t
MMRQPFHLHGLGVDVVYTDATFSQEAVYTDVGDSAIWTGHYLSAIAHRYASTGEAPLLATINRTLQAFDRL